jgi:pyruvate dehydrogenase E1 component alpha subunit
LDNYHFEIVKVMDENGNLLIDKQIDLNDEQLREMYKHMVFGRTYDERAFRLQRQGRLGTYTLFSGQEAVQIGSASLLEEGDWLFPWARDLGACFKFGRDVRSALLFSMGHIEGNRVPEGKRITPLGIIIPSQVPQAVGAAWASKLKGEDRVVLTTFGDGATSKGDFHEALNIAGIVKAPVVFLCTNNQWAISVPFHKQSASPTIAQKAVAYGMEGVRVDGNDIFAVYEVTKKAIEKARRGEGPTLIEAVTYRVTPHTTSDDPTRYRDENVAQEWKDQRDPIQRLKKYMENKQLWTEADEEQTREWAKKEISDGVKAAESTPRTKLTDIFDNVYEQKTNDLKYQQDMAHSFISKKGDVH